MLDPNAGPSNMDSGSCDQIQKDGPGGGINDMGLHIMCALGKKVSTSMRK